MKVGTNDATELKALADGKGIPFANLLRGYALEDLMMRVCGSDYREFLWLRDDDMLGEKSYRQGREGTLVFFYVPSPKPIPQDKIVPGQQLSQPLAEQFFSDIFLPENHSEILWETDQINSDSAHANLSLTANYRDMRVPVNMQLRTLLAENCRPEPRTLETLGLPKKRTISYQVYSSENQLCQDLFQIMDKLELIGDMGAYLRTYRTLRTQPLSGRRIIEGLEELSATSPTIKNERRLEQVRGYR
ncbi:MAG: hypothetical protein LUI02_03990, partial [Clostridiales bacterium]|nr:hypothetical protein [Clostridiales bacterium]